MGKLKFFYCLIKIAWYSIQSTENMGCLLLLSVALAFSVTNGLFIKLNPDLAVFNVSANGTIIGSAEISTDNLTVSANGTIIETANQNATAEMVAVDAANNTESEDNSTSAFPNIAIPPMPTLPSNLTGATSVDAPSVSSTEDFTDSSGNVTSDSNSTEGNSSAVAEAIENKGFNQTEEENDISVPIPGVNQTKTAAKSTVCKRGFRPVFEKCIESRFTRNKLVGTIVSPPCDEDKHCPKNAFCEKSQHLCQCANGQPLDETHCEASGLGDRCDNFGSKREQEINVRCKSPWTPCVKGVCSCPETQYRQGESCFPLLSLDNDCVSGGIPCLNDEVACLDAEGDKCGPKATCTCKCKPGFLKNTKTKTCEKPSPKPTTDLSKEKRAKEKITTTAATTTTTSKPTKPNHASSTSVSRLFYTICGLTFIVLL